MDDSTITPLQRMDPNSRLLDKVNAKVANMYWLSSPGKEANTTDLAIVHGLGFGSGVRSRELSLVIYSGQTNGNRTAAKMRDGPSALATAEV